MFVLTCMRSCVTFQVERVVESLATEGAEVALRQMLLSIHINGARQHASMTTCPCTREGGIVITTTISFLNVNYMNMMLR